MITPAAKTTNRLGDERRRKACKSQDEAEHYFRHRRPGACLRLHCHAEASGVEDSFDDSNPTDEIPLSYCRPPSAGTRWPLLEVLPLLEVVHTDYSTKTRILY